MDVKVGFGYDIHRLVEGRKLFLGGLEIPFVKGLYGHSDGDVLIHAICDSLLGAVGGSDIGKLFPNNDPQYAGISSLILLERVYQLVASHGFKISNIDVTVVCDEPHLEPFKFKMSEAIAKTLKIEATCINIKATTQEGLGEIGKGEAIAAYAVSCLVK
ncbi:MAG: 2-C-methyl-D-erythritol 2,4-cyclodiphosphate synthase [Candidatus Omnitrophota bacterium]